MAVIDSFLRTVLKNKVDILEFQPSMIPLMRKGNESWQVSKSPLADQEIQRMLREIVPDRSEFPPPLPHTNFEFEYPFDDGVFHFKAHRRANGWIAAVVVKDPNAPPILAGPIKKVKAEKDKVITYEKIESIQQLLKLLVSQRGSDLHLCSGQKPRIRVDGDLRVLEKFKIPSEADLHQLIAPTVPPRNREEFEHDNDTDFGWAMPEIERRFRVNLYRDRFGINGVFREIPTKIPTADQMELTKEVRELAYLSKGLVIVTGPTGSGKSTTLAAIIDLANRNRNDHILTIEDPVEFVHPSKMCLVNQREVGVHTNSFARALRAGLREDPDIVMIGELRDLETTAMAIETAETGHLVFATLHTTSAISTVDRLIDQFPVAQQQQIRLMLSESLKGVIAQVLLKRMGGGRIAGREILLVNGAVANLIRESKTYQIVSVMQTGKKAGMITLNDSLADLVRRKIVDPKEAYFKAIDKDDLLRRFGAIKVDRSFLEEMTA